MLHLRNVRKLRESIFALRKSSLNFNQQQQVQVDIIITSLMQPHDRLILGGGKLCISLPSG